MNYRVWLRSTSGIFAQYAGHVDVVADTAEDAKTAALAKLRRTLFPDRDSSMWKIERVEEH